MPASRYTCIVSLSVSMFIASGSLAQAGVIHLTGLEPGSPVNFHGTLISTGGSFGGTVRANATGEVDVPLPGETNAAGREVDIRDFGFTKSPSGIILRPDKAFSSSAGQTPNVGRR